MFFFNNCQFAKVFFMWFTVSCPDQNFIQDKDEWCAILFCISPSPRASCIINLNAKRKLELFYFISLGWWNCTNTSYIKYYFEWSVCFQVHKKLSMIVINTLQEVWHLPWITNKDAVPKKITAKLCQPNKHKGWKQVLVIFCETK